MSNKPVPVAVVGMSALLPGASDLQTYWRNIVDACDCLTDIPDDHSWSPKDYYDADPATPDKTWATKGGFIGKTPFDPMQHGVIPVALEAIDTDQLLALIVARECLRDAGLDPDGEDWDRDRTSVILGHTSTNELVVDLSARLHGPTWRRAMARQGVPETVIDKVVEDIARFFPTWQEQSFPGMLANVSAGRIANRLDLGGTNATVDAACASSLGAMHYAIAELQAGRTDMVLSGGTDTLNDIFMYMCFSKTPALSKSGDSRPFSSDGDGIVISEGIALFALKRLPDAERDGDRIYAVIQGIGTSSDGRNKSIYAPASSGQVKAVRRAYDEAGFDLETIELIEAHGTGTKAGDLAEFNGLREIFKDSTREGAHVALGSVKSQIGHTKATAGAAGLMKVVLALHQKVLPPTAKVTSPNPKMAFEGTPLYLNTQARPWVHAGEHPRRAGVSAFGFGGTNYHFAVQEYAAGPEVVSLPATEELFLVGADTDESLLEALDALATADHPTLAHASRATLETWTPGSRVVAFTADAPSTLTSHLRVARELVRSGTPAVQGGVHYAHPTDEQARLGVLFPGQGSQYVDMGRTAALRHPALRQALDRAEQALVDAGRGSLAARIYPAPAWSDAETDAQKQGLTATEWAQPALGAIETGLWNTLKGFGIQAHAFAGHSYGELVALHAAGAYDEATLWELSRVRGEAMKAEPGADRGTMAAVRGDIDAVRTAIEPIEGVVLANLNHPTQAVIAGTREGIAAAVKALADAGLSAMEIPVSAAFHSPLVADARAPLAAALEKADIQAPAGTVYADVTAAPYPADPAAVRQLLADQVVSQVDWVGIVKAMLEDGVRTFIECGPKDVLSRLVKRCAKGVKDVTLVALDGSTNRLDGDAQLKRALVILASRGVAVDVAPLLAERLPALPLAEGSKATVWLGGANFKRPETLAPPAPEPPAPYMPKREQPAARVHADGSVERPRASRPAPRMDTDVAGPPLLTAGRGASDNNAPKSAPKAAPAQAPAPARAPIQGAALASLLDATRESLRAFQETQARTAEVHARFLEGHQKATESFTALFESQTRLVELAATGDASALERLGARPAPAPRPVAPVARPATPPVVAADHDALAAAIVRPTGPQRATTLEMPTNDGPAVRGSDDLPPMLSARALKDLVKGGGELPAVRRAPTPVVAKPAPATATPAVDVRGALLATVAEKTGYPADLLEDGMDLETDLGVDSIKRVEILSAVQEAIPGLPEIPDEELASLRTLGDIAARLRQALPEPAGAVAGAPAAFAPEVPSLPPRKGAGAADVHRVVMGVVADKTGYPEDLLGIAMDLETDLGIDSIKRVEILSALQEALPSLPDVPDEELASLRTLGDIVECLQGAAGTPATAAPAAASSGPAAEDVLRQVVASRTGYPEDLLEMSMDLETDLGIDSIKRVEILSALQEALPDLPDLPEDELATARTLADIVALVDAHRGATAPAAPVPAAPVPEASAQAAPTGATRREVVVAPAPEGTAVTVGGTVVLTRDRLGLADGLAAALVEQGVSVAVIDPDWESRETVAEALPERIGGVVHMAALGAIDEDLGRRLRGGFLLAQATGPVPLFATVSGLGGTFGHDRLVGDPLQGALAGLAKTVGLEWGDTRALALDIDPDNADLVTLAEEILTDRGVVEIGCDDGSVTLDAVPVSLNDASPSEAPLEPGDLVVVSGGARGVTASVVTELARRFRPTLLLLGRSPLPEGEPAWAVGVADDDLKPARIAVLRKEGAPFDPRGLERDVASVKKAREVRATLAACEEAGATPIYAVADVCDDEAVRQAISKAVRDCGPVRGVVHGAGVIEDKLLLEKSADSFDRVWSTKVEGLRVLLRHTDVAELRMAAVFSSVAGRYGNRGQVDYAMANEAITHLCHGLRHQGVAHVKAFHWGPWAGGMVTPTLAAAFRARGLSLVGLDEGAAAFCDELERGGPDVEVVIGGPERPEGLLGESSAAGVAHTLTGESTVVLSGDQTFLDDHRIDGKPVLPFVMAVEFMADAARKAAPDLHFVGVRDVAVLKGVVLDNGETRLTLHWSPTAASPQATVALAFELRGAPNKLGLPTVHYRGTVDLSDQAPAGNRFPGSNGLGKQAYPYAVTEAYDRFLFHGPGFQGIEVITGMSDHGIVGQLAASRPKRLGMQGSSWTTDPVTLDSALQLVGLWVREHKGASALPNYVERYVQTAPFRGRVSAHIEMEPTKSKTGRYNATFVDQAGRVVARIDGGKYTSMPGLEDRYHGKDA